MARTAVAVAAIALLVLTHATVFVAVADLAEEIGLACKQIRWVRRTRFMALDFDYPPLLLGWVHQQERDTDCICNCTCLGGVGPSCSEHHSTKPTLADGSVETFSELQKALGNAHSFFV